MKRHKQHVFTPHELRQIAVAALCDPVTVRKFLNRRPVRPLSAQRIEAALRQLGIDGEVITTAA